ncbi:MAG TPA: PASTA domain-containing protein [Actinomycetota bacterium]|nr:PASTA domain-containing protein [Actinomycetota bacterium]
MLVEDHVRLLSGRYRINSRIGGGGMGDVYRGQDLLLERPVAVKLLHSDLARDEALVRRFKREAQAAARLTSPHIVAVHDWGYDEGSYYMVMELVFGRDLRDLLARSRTVEPSQARRIIADVCRALATAHAAGLVHRDVKPENILIARDGVVKVADFGIAAIAGKHTDPGGIVTGTLSYLAPEGAAGAEVGPAADIWAAGAVLSELLTGRGPARTGTVAEVLTARMYDPPIAPSVFDPRIGADLDRVVLRACALEPSLRYGSALEMAGELEAGASSELEGLVDDVTGEVDFAWGETTLLSAATDRGRRVLRRGRRHLLAGAAAVFVLLAVVAGAAAFVGSPPPAPALTGTSRGAAERQLKELGVDLVIEGRRFSWDIARGTILQQHPAAGTPVEGRIAVILAGGPPHMPLPDLEGLELDVASTRIAARGSEVGKIVEQHSGRPAGTVIRYSPDSATIPFGSTIDLVVSLGPVPVPIPAVVGERAAKAERLLKAAGFEVKLLDAYSDEVGEGVVITVAPDQGTQAPKGSTIEVYVSAGPRFKELDMPDVRGMDVNAATARLTDLNLRVDVVQSCGGGGTTVSESDPISGTQIRENDLIVLFVC